MSASIGVSSCWRRSRFVATLVTCLIHKKLARKKLMVQYSKRAYFFPCRPNNLHGYPSIVPRVCDQLWLLDWYPNHADSNLPSSAVGVFETRLLRQLFGLGNA